MSDWYELELGDVILSDSDVIGYGKASCKSVGITTITANNCLSSFRTAIFFRGFFFSLLVLMFDFDIEAATRGGNFTKFTGKHLYQCNF